MYHSDFYSMIISCFFAVLSIPVSIHSLVIADDLLFLNAYASDSETSETSETSPDYVYPLGTLGDDSETPIDNGTEFVYEPPSASYIESYESDTALYDTEKLNSIDYSLKIIAGGVILAIDSAFVWFMILKPLKRFVVF